MFSCSCISFSSQPIKPVKIEMINPVTNIFFIKVVFDKTIIEQKKLRSQNDRIFKLKMNDYVCCQKIIINIINPKNYAKNILETRNNNLPATGSNG
jgi:hypothetical protein